LVRYKEAVEKRLHILEQQGFVQAYETASYWTNLIDWFESLFRFSRSSDESAVFFCCPFLLAHFHCNTLCCNSFGELYVNGSGLICGFWCKRKSICNENSFFFWYLNDTFVFGLHRM
jgi:hypothetical protein